MPRSSIITTRVVSSDAFSIYYLLTILLSSVNLGEDDWESNPNLTIQNSLCYHEWALKGADLITLSSSLNEVAIILPLYCHDLGGLNG